MHGILNHRLSFGFSQVGVLALNSSDYNEGCFTLIQFVSSSPAWLCGSGGLFVMLTAFRKRKTNWFLTFSKRCYVHFSCLFLKDKAGDILDFSHRSKTSNELILTSIICEAKAKYNSVPCAIDLHCCPETIKSTSVSYTVALGGMALHCDEHSHCRIDPTYTVLLL